MGRGRRIGQWQQFNPPFSSEEGQAGGEGEGAARTVARRFRGEFHQKVDAKGRVSIPALFRRVLEAEDPDWKEGLRPQLVIVYGDHRRNYLECFTINAINQIDARIDRKPRGSPKRKILERLYQGQSMTTEVDHDGRLVLPQRLREKIGLGDEAFFIASGDHFEIWNPRTYEEVETARTQEFLDSLPPDVDVLSFLDEDD